MNSSPAPRLLATFVALLFAASCGGAEEGANETPDGNPASESDGIAPAVQEGIADFIPEADQFGIQQFMVAYDLEGQETGTRTMWVEAYGDRVGMEEIVTVGPFSEHRLYYWDGERSHMQTLPDGQVAATPIRTRASEPSSFATTPASDLEMVGYTRVGDKTIAGRVCEHWRNQALNFEGCRWNRIELEFLNGAGTDQILQTSLATEVVEGEGIPDRILALAR